MRTTIILLLAALWLNAAADEKTTERIDLSGTWQFALDRQGLVKPGDDMTDTVRLPGTTDTNKKGDFIGCRASGPTRAAPGIAARWTYPPGGRARRCT